MKTITEKTIEEGSEDEGYMRGVEMISIEASDDTTEYYFNLASLFKSKDETIVPE